MFARAALVFVAGAIVATPALAIRMDGDDYQNVPQKNPAFLEPYADESAARYRVGDPREGLAERRAIAAERHQYRGDVRVRPYYRY